MRITGALVYSEDKKFNEKELYIRNGLIADMPDADDEIIDASGCYVIPGLLDIHFHGALGCDVCDTTLMAFEKIAEYEASRGITAICPATLTLPEEELKKVLSLGAEFSMSDHPGMSDLVGFNMEGPFISRKKKGAQNEKYIRPCDAHLVGDFLKASKGLLKIIGLAPEENPGFEEYVRETRGKVKVSLAHTAADYDEAMRAFDAGASHAVHLYNAMTGVDHRAPGVVGAVFDREDVTAELICDGVHIHPAVVRNAFKLLGPDRIVMISDSLRCTGMPDGTYDLGGLEVRKQGEFCRLEQDGNIAGSVSDLFDCLRKSVKDMHIPIEEAVAAATINPAKAIGVDDKYGVLANGRNADFIVINRDDFTIRSVYKRASLIK